MIPWHQPELVVEAVLALVNQDSHQNGAENGLPSPD